MKTLRESLKMFFLSKKLNWKRENIWKFRRPAKLIRRLERAVGAADEFIEIV